MFHNIRYAHVRAPETHPEHMDGLSLELPVFLIATFAD